MVSLYMFCHFSPGLATHDQSSSYSSVDNSNNIRWYSSWIKDKSTCTPPPLEPCFTWMTKCCYKHKEKSYIYIQTARIRSCVKFVCTRAFLHTASIFCFPFNADYYNNLISARSKKKYLETIHDSIAFNLKFV